MNDTAKLALTCGDPAGVGPEIIARWLAENPQEAARVVAVGPRRWLETLPCAGAAVGADDFEIAPGRPSAEGQRVALAAMERAAAGTLSGEFSGVVTAPVNKAGLKSVGYAFPGQTEFFAARWGGVPVMAFAGGRLSVVLATWHIPLKDIPAALTAETLERAVVAADFLARRFSRAAGTAEAVGGAFPRIGLCGLNPHAGEGGILGSEEIERIEPAASRLITIRRSRRSRRWSSTRPSTFRSGCRVCGRRRITAPPTTSPGRASLSAAVSRTPCASRGV